MSICSNNKDLISDLNSKVSTIKQEELDQHNKMVAKIESLRDDIKAVLLTLTDCVDSSKLRYNFGNVRLIDLSKFIDCLNDYVGTSNKYADKSVSGIIHHDHFLKVFNEITYELFGTTYREMSPTEVFESVKLLWDKETLATYTIGYFKSCLMYLSFLWLIALMFLPITILFIPCMYFVCMFEYKPKFSLAKYKPDCISINKWI